MLAHLVLGPESSNPAKAAKDLIAAGCTLHTNLHEVPTKDSVVIIKPVPDGPIMPMLHGIVETLLKAGYEIRVTVTERDWSLMVEMYLASNSITYEQAEAVVRDSYERIFTVIRDFKLRFSIVHTGEAAVEVRPIAPVNTKQRKLLFYTHMSPGDIMMLTATVRDLHKAHPGKFITDVYTSCGEIWQNNPYITKLKWKGVQQGDKWVPETEDPDIEVITCHYNGPFAADVNKSAKNAYHFVHGFTQYIEHILQIRIPVTEFKGEIYLADAEKRWMSQVDETGYKGRFWIMMAGGKPDFTTKWWNPAYYQKVVNHFKDRILFVQCGEKHHWHPPLEGVLNLVGKTDTRKFIRLMYHASGVVCPITFAMHLSAAVPSKEGRVHRPCVVIAGGREGNHWEQYPHHTFLHRLGCLPCCDRDGCWRSRCQKMNDGDEKDHESRLCFYPVKVSDELSIAKCMDMISPEEVIQSIERYLEYDKLKPEFDAARKAEEKK